MQTRKVRRNDEEINDAKLKVESDRKRNRRKKKTCGTGTGLGVGASAGTLQSEVSELTLPEVLGGRIQESSSSNKLKVESDRK